MPTIAHLSDLHLQSGVPARQAQVEPILAEINRRKPDLVVISGDVTDDGWDSIEELKWAKAWLDERIEGDWFAVPGNHDVGNFVDQKLGQITDQGLKNYNQVFGPQPLIEVVSGDHANSIHWKIVGINSMLAGSETGRELAQFKWINEQFDQCHNKCATIVLFLHSPLFIEHPNEMGTIETSYWLGPIKGRKDLLNHMDIDCVSLIASGHVHQTRLAEVDGVQIAWAPPASGTWVHAPGLPNPPMPEQTGFFLHHLHDDGRVESELVECAPMLKCIEFNPYP